jgi:hydrogenase/urease accessory protein HupE
MICLSRTAEDLASGRWIVARHLCLTALFYTFLCSMSAVAHEVRPAYLAIDALAADHFQVTWKQPILGDRRLRLDPILPESCDIVSEALPEHTSGALILRWEVACDLSSGQIHIEGLSRTLTDVMVRIADLDGRVTTLVLKPDSPSLTLDDPAPPIAVYLTLGMEHLLFGIDHILFVVGLVLFIANRWMLLKTITAFTAAHSITLALSVLEVVKLPQQPVEAIIALSILFLARELMLPPTERSALMLIRPWLMAFTFGLLHGFGFAGALADIGLPREALGWSLLLFNLGIEAGQLLIITVMLAIAWFIKRSNLLQAPGWQFTFTFVMGSVAAYWTIDRITAVF